MTEGDGLHEPAVPRLSSAVNDGVMTTADGRKRIGELKDRGDVVRVFRGINKSCEFCGRRKRKCDGDGVNPCSRCLRKGTGQVCVYPKRRPNSGRPRLARAERVSTTVAIEPERHEPSSHAVSSAGGAMTYGHYLRLDGVQSLKRCRMSASPATGLVGLEENVLLGDYFGGVGFIPLTCESDIRAAMVAIMTASITMGHRSVSFENKEVKTSDCGLQGDLSAPPAAASTSEGGPVSTPGAWGTMGTSTSMFWCAVALGGLIRGQPIESVSRYVRLAKRALDECSDSATAEFARACTMLAYLHGFLGDNESFFAFVERSDDLLRTAAAQGLPNDPVTVGTVRMMNHTDEVKILQGGNMDVSVLKSFCDEDFSPTELGETVTRREVFQYVTLSYRVFEQAFYEDVIQRANPVSRTCDGQNEACTPASTPTEEEDSQCSFVVDLSGDRAAELPRLMEKNMIHRMRVFPCKFEALEQAVDRPDIGTGIGGIVINGTLVFAKVARNDMEGALERVIRCVDIFARFPGICRFELGRHVAHVMIAALAIMNLEELYDRLRTAFNPMRPEGTLPIPSLAEWNGIETFCGHVYCRSWERTLATFEVASGSSHDSADTEASDLAHDGHDSAERDNGNALLYASENVAEQCQPLDYDARVCSEENSTRSMPSEEAVVCHVIDSELDPEQAQRRIESPNVHGFHEAVSEAEILVGSDGFGAVASFQVGEIVSVLGGSDSMATVKSLEGSAPMHATVDSRHAVSPAPCFLGCADVGSVVYSDVNGVNTTLCGVEESCTRDTINGGVNESGSGAGYTADFFTATETFLDMATASHRARQSEAEEDSGSGISTADWLDVTHAMLDHVDPLLARRSVFDDSKGCDGLRR